MLASGRDAMRDGTGRLLLASARDVQSELPKRLARRLMDLQLLPFVVVSNPHVRAVYDAYRHAFDTLVALPPVETPAANDAFTDLLRRLVDEHAPMLDALAAGLREVTARPFTGPRLDLDAFLESMLRSRVSRRVLAEHHIGLASPRPGHVGAICASINLVDAVEHAGARTRAACAEAYGVAPEVVVDAPPAASIPHIPAHVDYCLFELLKNAARATVEAAAAREGGRGRAPRAGALPPVRVRVCDAPGDAGSATMVVSDVGGGIDPRHLDAVWRFGFTTAEAGVGGPADDAAASPLAGLGGSPASPDARYRLAGLGFGLPLSRLYARYFGGDVRLVSMPGYGVDAFLTLPHLDGDWWVEGGGRGGGGEEVEGVVAVRPVALP
jgi:[3-methyl-2-oxobutanoate dehydrogenase (acetyl-transferring)] kinase